jgi:Sugar (and other) transporter
MMIGGSSIMTVTHALPAPAVAPNRSVAAAVIGNAMEWYDFAVYGFFASIIGKLFFPASEPSLSVIAALGVFAVGFLMRPIGGIFFGYIGDRYGRTFSLFLSIGAMALGTLAMGLLPTYETAGVLAPVLMITCRIVQGLARYACFGKRPSASSGPSSGDACWLSRKQPRIASAKLRRLRPSKRLNRVLEGS